MNDKQLHYRCTFTIQPQKDSKTLWADSLKVIRRWFIEKIKEFKGNNEYFIDAWFFKGGSWQCNNVKHIKVETFKVQGNGTIEIPQFWAVRFEHSDKLFSHRTWVIDFVVEKIDNNSLLLSLTISHNIRAGYIGIEPDLPIATSPKIVRNFLEQFNCFSGDIKLSEFPISLRDSSVREIWNNIKSPQRKCPIIIIRSNFVDEYLIDPAKIASLVKGTAIVYQLDNQDYEEEFKYYMGNYYWNYNCPRGHVRIYLPNVNLNYVKDYTRHRFFKPDIVSSLEAKKEIEDIIVRAISRRFILNNLGAIFSVEGVQQKDREQKLIALKGNSSNLSEYIQLLEDSNSELTNEVNNLKKDLNKEKEDVEYFSLENEELKNNIEKIEKEANFKVRKAYDDLNKAREQKAAIESKIETITDLTNLPKSLNDVLKVIFGIHKDKIYVCENAFISASNSDYNDIDTAWQALWHTATTLFDIYFLEKQVDIPNKFKSKSGFDLSLSEGSLTKENKGLMELRKINYNGEIIDIIPHVKADKKGKNLRIYYYVDNKNRKIVIGHCGDHLDTHGTKVRKQG